MTAREFDRINRIYKIGKGAKVSSHAIPVIKDWFTASDATSDSDQRLKLADESPMDQMEHAWENYHAAC